MEFNNFFAQLLAIALGSLIALIFTFYVIWPKIESLIFKLNNLQHNKLAEKDSLQLKFAAYERLLFFTHRISPSEVMLRNHQPTLSVVAFKQLIIADIENEYQHNFTQQLYVSDAAWTLIRDLKDNTIALMRNASKGQSSDSGLDNYIETVLKHVREQEVNPYQATQVLLKRELSN